MSRHVLCLWGILICLGAQARPVTPIDSLENLLQNENREDKRLELYVELASLYLKPFDSTQAKKNIQKAIELAHRLDKPLLACKAQLLKATYTFMLGHIEQAIELNMLVYEKTNILKSPFLQAKALLNLSNCYYRLGDYDISEKKAQESLELYNLHQDSTVWANSLWNLGKVQYRLGNYDSSLIMTEQAWEIMQLQDDPYLHVGICNTLASIFFLRGKIEKSLKYFLTGLEVAESFKDDRLLAVLYNNLAHIYLKIGEYSKALSYAIAASEKNQKLNSPFDLCINYINISQAYFEMGNYKLSLDFSKQAKVLSAQNKYKRGLWLSHFWLGKVFLSLEKWDSSHYHVQTSLGISQKLGDKDGITAAHKYLGKLAFHLKNYPEALKHLNKSMDLALELGNPSHIQFILDVQSQTYAALGRYDLAYQKLQESWEIKDSLVGQKSVKRLAILDAEYSFQKRQDSLEIVQQNERMLFESQLNLQMSQQYSTNIALVGVILILTIIILFYRSKVKANRALMGLNNEISRQNEMIKEQKDELEETLKDKDRFFSIISHDLRSPIHSFSSLSPLITEAIQSGAFDDLGHYVTLLESSSKNVSQLLENLLLWSRQQQGLIPYEPIMIDLAACIENTLSLYRVQIEAKNLKVEATLFRDLYIWADQHSLATVFRNLISNAIKFTPEEGTIYLETRLQGLEAYMQIRDTGVGIPPEELENIFASHYKKSHPGTKGEPGSGLGLVLVYNFVEMNQGRIEVQSSLGEGTNFSLYLPIFHSQKVSYQGKPQTG